MANQPQSLSLLFLVYRKGHIVDRYYKLPTFADDLGIFKSVSSVQNCELTQSHIVSYHQWSEWNDVGLNLDKCYRISFFRTRNYNNFKLYYWQYSFRKVILNEELRGYICNICNKWVIKHLKHKVLDKPLSNEEKLNDEDQICCLLVLIVQLPMRIMFSLFFLKSMYLLLSSMCFCSKPTSWFPVIFLFYQSFHLSFSVFSLIYLFCSLFVPCLRTLHLYHLADPVVFHELSFYRFFLQLFSLCFVSNYSVSSWFPICFLWNLTLMAFTILISLFLIIYDSVSF